MPLNTFLVSRKQSVISRWFDSIIEAYPEDTKKFLRSQKDRFANPVGSTILNGLEGIFQEVVAEEEMNRERLNDFLDSIIRVRAVQSFSPSAALAFLLGLKKGLRAEVEEHGKGEITPAELAAADERIDAMILLSFDIYMQCREKIYEIKANEVKRSMFRLLQQAQLITGEDIEEPDSKEIEFLHIKRKEAT